MTGLERDPETDAHAREPLAADTNARELLAADRNVRELLAADRNVRELLAHGTWLRRLARAIVRDADAAEDLVQDAWVVALKEPALASRSSLRAWLATVVRNLARERARSDARRRA